MKLYHLPLEPYRQRYTEWLHKVERRDFKKSGFNYTPIRPGSASAKAVIDIQSGRVLDTMNRPLWALEQIAGLISQAVTSPGVAYFSDFYTPGLDAIPYSGCKLDIGAFLWAQTFDQYDFTTQHISWMRPWEVMAFDIYNFVFVAHDLLRELIVSAIPSAHGKLHTVGLPFSTKIVRKQLDMKEVPNEKYDVAYTSRWDQEKNPNFFLDLVAAREDLQFVVCTGHADLRGSDQKAVDRAKRMAAERSNLTILTGCTKGRYYAVLSRTKVQFNSALQDWISFTLLEALAFGCSPLYPNFRSFPDTLQYYEPSLYTPFDSRSALDKLDDLLTNPFPRQLTSSILSYHNGTMKRVAKILKG